MLIVFDVDGTLIGGETHDWASFDLAIRSVVGLSATKEFFLALPEITAQVIAEAAVRAMNHSPGTGLEERIRQEYLGGLRRAHGADARAFAPRPGVPELLAHLESQPGVGVAIATGDWLETISFKLGAAGIDVSRYPMATSSDCPRRPDIIRLAAQRAGRDLADVVYVGDGVWDLKACRELGVPFIGTGSRPHLLKDAGAQHLVEVMEPQPFLQVVRRALG